MSQLQVVWVGTAGEGAKQNVWFLRFNEGGLLWVEWDFVCKINNSLFNILFFNYYYYYYYYHNYYYYCVLVVGSFTVL
mgnify:CR=1 FL=1